MQWDFDSEGRASLRPVTDIPSLLPTNGTNLTPKPVIQHDCSKAHKYLCLWNSPTMSMKANLKGLAINAKNYSHRLFKSGLSMYEVSLAYFHALFPPWFLPSPSARLLWQNSQLSRRHQSGRR
jgi:hypothetical protein